MRGVADIAGIRWLALATLVAVPLGIEDARAASPICRQLEAELASLPSGSIGGRQARRYDQAIATQMREMEEARAQAREAGCDRGFLARSAAFCGSLNATLSRMQMNLVTLQGRRAQLGGSGRHTGRERARIEAAIEVNGCNEPQRSLPEPVEQRRPGETIVIDGRNGQRIGGELTGSFRTLCVRMCDGYYFPISYSVSAASFPRDQRACEARCPGADVDLFYHRVPGEESQDMVSASTRLPYAELENAFLYRRTDVPEQPSCGCGTAAADTRHRGFEIIGGEGAQPGAEARVPLPAAEQEPAEKEVQATVEKEPTGSAEERKFDPDREIRRVGPRFFPDPEGAIDLRVPDPAPAR